MKSLCLGQSVALEKWEIEINRGGVAHPFAHNGAVRTTKYNAFTFLPKALFEQFRRVANVYFAIHAALSLTAFSPVRPWTTWTPLCLVIGVSVLKEAIEDYYRWVADKEVNNRMVDVLNHSSHTFEPHRWRDVVVGDIVRVERNEFFPADLLLLSAGTVEGTCYVETMNLDGETNLKIKAALDQTKDLTSQSVAHFSASVHCEPPNSALYRFVGNLMLTDKGGNSSTVPIAPSTVLLRGSSLKNTDHILGAVIYSGHDTKVFQNASEAPSKRSTLEHIIDRIVIFMFVVLFFMCLITAIYFSSWLEAEYTKHWYLGPKAFDSVGQYDPDTKAKAGTISFLVGFILYGYLIPISLYVSLEVVKVFQAIVLIGKDRDMYHALTDTPAKARTSNLNEDLGRVSAILSDKTGTLTCNVMEFFKCSIAGVNYGAGVTEIERANAERKGTKLPPSSPGASSSSAYREPFFNFYDARLMDGAWMNEDGATEIEMFFRMLAVCHTIVPDGPANVKEIKYEAESPDEAALVVAAKAMGFFFFKRTNTCVSVRETTAAGTSDMEYELLNVLEFNSTRKRMSVIVRDSAGQLLLFCKGADTVVYERLDPAWATTKAMKASSSAHMEYYGASGLRTLCLAYKKLDELFYEGWQVKWAAAKTSLTDRNELMEELSELIEGQLRLLGCTAIEDKLQDGVGACIKQLADAGVRLWVLTGDKMETAINIAYACSLITDEMTRIVVTTNDAAVEAMEAAGDVEGATLLAHKMVEEQLQAVQDSMGSSAESDSPYAIIIDGKALSYALSDRLTPLLLSVGMRCSSAICCRVSPLQKAQVTTAVRSYGLVTLAIGDGANDVGMIQKAHIGVGISGQEGMQAVMAADFSIAQFQFLLPLLMVHGRWSYKRISRMVNYFFYKNMLFGITLFVFNAFTCFSGSFMYDDVYMTLFNVVFTVLMPLVIGVVDRDVDKDLGYRFPILYRAGLANSWFSIWAIAGWVVSATLQSLIIMTLCIVGTDSTIIDRAEGQPHSMYQSGVLAFSCVLLTLHLHLAYILEQWTWLHHLGMWLGLALWWFYLCAYGTLPLWLSQTLYKLFLTIVAPCPQYWLLLLLVSVAAVLPDFFFRMVKRHIYPDDHHIAAEWEWLQSHHLTSNMVAPHPMHPSHALAQGSDAAQQLSGKSSAAAQQSAHRSHKVSEPLRFQTSSSHGMGADGLGGPEFDDDPDLICVSVDEGSQLEDTGPKPLKVSYPSTKLAHESGKAVGEQPQPVRPAPRHHQHDDGSHVQPVTASLSRSASPTRMSQGKSGQRSHSQSSQNSLSSQGQHGASQGQHGVKSPSQSSAPANLGHSNPSASPPPNSAHIESFLLPGSIAEGVARLSNTAPGHSSDHSATELISTPRASADIGTLGEMHSE